MGYQWFGISRLDPGAGRPACARAAPFVDSLPRRHAGEVRARREQDRARRLLAGHDDGAACRPAPRHAARRHRRLLRHAGRAGHRLSAEIKSRPPVLLAARRQRRDAAASCSPSAPPRRCARTASKVAHAYRPGRRPRHRRDAACRMPRASCSRSSSCRCPSSADSEDRRHSASRASSASPRPSSRTSARHGEVGASVCADGRRRDGRRPVGRRRRSQDQRAVEEGHGQHRLLLHQGRDRALRPRAGEPRQARPRCAGRPSCGPSSASTARSA